MSKFFNPCFAYKYFLIFKRLSTQAESHDYTVLVIQVRLIIKINAYPRMRLLEQIHKDIKRV